MGRFKMGAIAFAAKAWGILVAFITIVGPIKG